MTTNARRATRVALGLVGLGLLAIPAVAVGLSGAASIDALWTALRVTALEAFTLVCMNIATGGFRPLFNKVAKPRSVHRVHMVTGIVGFVLAVGHGSMLLTYGFAGYGGLKWAGPAILFLLVVTIAAALERRSLRRSWRWIHRLNYVIFVAILVHGLALGYDLSGMSWLTIWFLVCAAVVAAAVAYRLAGTLRKRRNGQRR
jgi:DMSO/TMAO reductase YedYZ heme-binding membrane subunit